VNRILLKSLGSPLWSATSESEARDMLEFLHGLRGLFLSSASVGYVTIPTNLFSPSFINKVEHIADVVFAFESFGGSWQISFFFVMDI